MKQAGVKKKQVGKTFTEKVTEAVMSVPKGKVTTYGDLAKLASHAPMAAMTVSPALFSQQKKNPKLKIPWYKIVRADGSIFDTGKPELEKERMKMLKKEGIEVNEKGKIVNFGSKRHKF